MLLSMAVGAPNDLGGQQTSARKITCLSLSKLRGLHKNLNGFSAQIEVFSKKKGLHRNLNGFSVQLRCSPKKKKKKRKVFTEIWTVFLSKLRCSPKKKKKVITETETVFCQSCAQINKIAAQINRLFAQIFDVLNRMGGRPTPLPPASYGNALIEGS